MLPSSEYIFLPDRAHPVAPLVTVQGGHNPTRGSVYFVDVIVRKATILERLFGGLHNGADLFPASEINPPGIEQRPARRTSTCEDMKLSQQIAAAVALKALGPQGRACAPIGARIDDVEPGLPAVGKLEPDDVITAVNGTRVTSPAAGVGRRRGRARSAASSRSRSGGTARRCSRRCAPSAGTNPRRPVVGILLDASRPSTFTCRST